MIARSHDTHVRAMNSPHVHFGGVGSPPFLVQFIEQKAVVTHLLDSTSSLAAGIRIGDIVTTVDGEDVGARMRRFTPYVSASTPQSLLSSLAGFIIRGPDSSIGTYGLQDANGKTKTIHVLRRAGNRSLLKSWRYKGSTVLLIDERAISQAEHTGLFLKAASDITFVGGGTTGANGDVTEFILPGGITVRLTGQNVRFPDGRQLQRIGLVPDIEVRPTVRGFRAGRDEVLEKAIAYLNRKLTKKSLPSGHIFGHQ